MLLHNSLVFSPQGLFCAKYVEQYVKVLRVWRVGVGVIVGAGAGAYRVCWHAFTSMSRGIAAAGLWRPRWQMSGGSGTGYVSDRRQTRSWKITSAKRHGPHHRSVQTCTWPKMCLFLCCRLLPVFFFIHATSKRCLLKVLKGAERVRHLSSLCLRLMWGLCVRKPAGRREKCKCGSGGGGTRTVQDSARGSLRPGATAVQSLMWESADWTHSLSENFFLGLSLQLEMCFLFFCLRVWNRSSSWCKYDLKNLVPIKNALSYLPSCQLVYPRGG